MRRLMLSLVLLLPQARADDDGAKFVRIAAKVELGQSTAEVRKETEDLGKPYIAYEWCNGAGCVDRESETGATKMRVSWDKDRDIFGIEFCRNDGAWAVGSVTVLRRAPKDEWGSSPKPTALFRVWLSS